MTKQRVAVTGGLGYIGLHLCRKLRLRGYDVRVIDKGIFPSGVAAIHTFAPGCEVRIKDLRKVTRDDFVGCVAVCNLGGFSNDPTSELAGYDANISFNVDATMTTAHSALAVDCYRFIQASSASVYGFSEQVDLDEYSPVNPASDYAESKLLAETELLNMVSDDLEPVILRQATVGGWSPRMRWDLVVNTMVMTSLRDGVINVNAGGEASRPLIDVQDVADAHIRCIEAPSGDVGGEVFNLTHRRARDEQGAEGYRIASLGLWIARILESEHGVKVAVRGNWDRTEGRSYDISGKKLRRVLDWEPTRTVGHMVSSIMDHRPELNFSDPETRNLDWMLAMKHAQEIIKRDGSVW